MRLTVDDEGPGIPPEQREALLEALVRLETSRNRRTGGAGLGLAVVRSLVEAHGGIINIDDAPGGGARFTVSLPMFHARGATELSLFYLLSPPDSDVQNQNMNVTSSCANFMRSIAMIY